MRRFNTLIVPALLIAVGLEAATLVAFNLEVRRDTARIQVLSQELYGITDPLKASDPHTHENYIEDLQQGQADLESRVAAVEVSK